MIERRTRLGIEAENMGRAALDPGVIATALAIEAAGAASVSVSDHLLSFANTGGSARAALQETWLEAFTCLAAISSVTSRVRLITSVIILPQRNVLELVKISTTLDALSGGRFILGVGAGWNEREMTALGYDFAARGQRMDEQLQVISSVRQAAVPPFSGEQITVPEGIVMSPAPAPGRAIPLYIGGSGDGRAFRRRAIVYGDGWMPYGTVGNYDLAALRQTMIQLQEERARLGKAPLDTIFKLGVSGHGDAALERSVVELAGIGFDEIIVQGIWDAGLDNGIDAIGRLRRALDS